MFYDEEGMFFLSALPSHAYFMYKRLSHTSPAFPPPFCYYTLKNHHRISLIE